MVSQAYNGGNAGSASNALVILDDDYDDVVPEGDLPYLLDQEIRNYTEKGATRPRPRAPSLAASDSDETDNEAQREQELFNSLRTVIDLTSDDDDHHQGNRGVRQRRQHHQAEQEEELDVQRVTLPNGKIIKANFCYEVSAMERFFTVQFVQVQGFFTRGLQRRLFVRGLPLARNRTLAGQLPRKMNEVFAIYEVEDDDGRPIEEQALIEVPAGALLTSRRLHVTNAAYPKHRHDKQHFSARDDIERNGPLVCRWKYRVHFQDERKRQAGTPHEWAIVRITADEVVDPHLREDDEMLREMWRGKTIRGGEHNARGLKATPAPRPAGAAQPPGAGAGAGGRGGQPAAREQPQRPPTPTTRAPGQRYTMFDSFCGAGGASRGAERAGFQVKFGLDLWPKACESHRMNFPSAIMYEMDVYDFIHGTAGVAVRADILHLSPPCQVWSPAHTIAGANDERNIMALFACRNLIDRVRARIVTLEQTFGLLKPDFRIFFDSLLLGFTDHGYSISWKIVNCAAYGLPQRRTRLVMIGAGPGERLPSFPPPTHSSTGRDGLRCYTTIRQAVSKVTPSIAASDPHHNPRPSRPANDSVVGNPDAILPRCMTTSGGQNRHFNGERVYTNREFACLQGFPVWHKFSRTHVKKQIGNAFPPVVVQVLYEHIQQHLHKYDGLEGSAKPRPMIPEGVDVMTVVDEQEEVGVVGQQRRQRYQERRRWGEEPDVVDLEHGLRRESLSWPRSVSQEPLAGVSQQIPIVIEEEEEFRVNMTHGGARRASAAALAPSFGRSPVPFVDIRRRVPHVIRGVKQEQIAYY